VPERVAHALAAPAAETKRVKLAVSLRTESGFVCNATLRPRARRPYALFLNAEARADRRTGRVTLSITPVSPKRAVPTPRDLTLALREADALTSWASLPPGKREHIIGYIERAAHDATRSKRIAQAVEVTEKRRERQLARRGG
jgi:hypothetical protein